MRKWVLQPKHYRMPTSLSGEFLEKNVRRSNREGIGEMGAASRTENWRYAARASDQEACRYAATPGNTPVKDKENELLTDCYPAGPDALQTAIQRLQLVENKLLLNEEVRFEEKRKKEWLEKRIAAVESHSRLMVLRLEEIQQRMLIAADAWTTKQELFMAMPHIVHPTEVQHAALKAALRAQCVEAEHRRQQQQLQSTEQEQPMCMQQHSDEVLQVFMVNAVHSFARFCSDAPMQQEISAQEVFTKPSTETTEEEKATQSGREDDIAACDGKCRCAALESNAVILCDNEAKYDALIQDVQALQRQMIEYNEQAEQRLQDFHEQLEEQLKRNSDEIVCLEDDKVRVWSSREGQRLKSRSNTPTRSNKTQVPHNKKGMVRQGVDRDDNCLPSPCSHSDEGAPDQLRANRRKHGRRGGRQQRLGSVIAAVLKVLMGFSDF